MSLTSLHRLFSALLTGSSNNFCYFYIVNVNNKHGPKGRELTIDEKKRIEIRMKTTLINVNHSTICRLLERFREETAPKMKFEDRRKMLSDITGEFDRSVPVLKQSCGKKIKKKSEGSKQENILQYCNRKLTWKGDIHWKKVNFSGDKTQNEFQIDSISNVTTKSHDSLPVKSGKRKLYCKYLWTLTIKHFDLYSALMNI